MEKSQFLELGNSPPCFGGSFEVVQNSPVTMCAQVAFAWSPRIAKPTMNDHDCAVRLTFFLDMDERWHIKVHGLIDQCEFRVPLSHIVRAGGVREPGHLHLLPAHSVSGVLGYVFKSV